MNKVFIVVEKIDYEGECVMRVFGKYADAIVYADELTAAAGFPSNIDYDVYEREVY
jgi:hypothetical protein